MQLREKLRMDFSKYIRPIKMKEHCEVCGTTENLELHHLDQFIFTLEETLKELNLEEKDCDKYKENELKNIRNVMLGKQLKQSYLTLCTSCHDKEEVIRRNLSKRDEILKDIKRHICSVAIDTFDKDKCYRPYIALRKVEKRLDESNGNKNKEAFNEAWEDMLEIFMLNPKMDLRKYYKKYPERY